MEYLHRMEKRFYNNSSLRNQSTEPAYTFLSWLSKET